MQAVNIDTSCTIQSNVSSRSSCTTTDDIIENDVTINHHDALPIVNNNSTEPTKSTSVVDSTTSSTTETFDRRSLRLYSKKHRVYIFREFILKTYQSYLCKDAIILDVAGGKGDLSWILTNIDQYQSIVVDPRRTINHIDKSVNYLRQYPDECIKRSVPNQSSYQPLAALMPILERNNYHIQSPRHLRIFVDDELVHVIRNIVNNVVNCMDEWEQYWDRAIQRTVHYITPSGKNDFSIDRVNETDNTIYDTQIALQLILHAKLIVGYHPDQATDACFVLASLLNIPVCVVPCCVFPSEFLHRRLRLSHDDDDRNLDSDVEVFNYNDSIDSDSTAKAVETYEELILYLQQQFTNIRTDTLEFPGTTTARRIVLYTLPQNSQHIEDEINEGISIEESTTNDSSGITSSNFKLSLT